MKLVTFERLDGSLAIGELRGDTLYAVETDTDMRGIAGDSVLPTTENAHKVMKHNGLRAPIQPSKIFCVGRNYSEHAAEVDSTVPEKPLIFSKYPSCVIADGDSIEWQQSITQQVDWEGELVVVIGKTARRIREEDAYDHIFGYTIANDVSARDIQYSESQWVRAKAQDTFCPLGPAIVTKDDIPDPHTLDIRTTVNGETMQDSNTQHMVFKIPYLIAYLSQTFTLLPGDLILTGTPAGVGKGMKPPRYLTDGEEVAITIEGIGTLTNPCKIID